ncbi:hypothetical protein [Streptomyces sp. NPDC053431]|uniref:hypothetical protein n=1 Tax=Streptomyces sp. NPDC053431 TaxID=3365703 RepID=UPI0037D23968
MTRVAVEGTEIVVRLGLRETLAARRHTVRVPAAALRGVGVEASWWRVLRGAAGPGMWLPGRCVGTRHGPDGTDFVAVRSDGPALYMDLAPDAPFRRVAVSVADPDETERALRAVMPGGPEPPAERDGTAEPPAEQRAESPAEPPVEQPGSAGPAGPAGPAGGEEPEAPRGGREFDDRA